MSFKHTTPIFQSEVITYENGIRSIVDHIPSKYLTDANGNYVIDPTSPTGEPYIVPANMNFDQMVQKAADLYTNTPLTSASVLMQFKTGEALD